eukprot:gene13398-13526_t
MALDENYWMFVHKVAPCPLRERHDWSACPYAHRGERAARRCPKTCSYSAQPCAEYNKAVVPAPFTRTGSSPARSVAPGGGTTGAHEPLMLAAGSSLAAGPLMQQHAPAPQAAVVAADAPAAGGAGWVLTGQDWMPMEPGAYAGGLTTQQPPIHQLSLVASEGALVPADMAALLAVQLDGLVLQQRLLPGPQAAFQQGHYEHTMVPPSLAGGASGSAAMHFSLAMAMSASGAAQASHMGIPGSASGAGGMAAAELYASLGGVPSMPMSSPSLGTQAQPPHNMSRFGQQHPGGWH